MHDAPDGRTSDLAAVPGVMALWHAVIRLGDEALFLATADGRLRAASPRAAALLGCGTDGLPAARLQDLFEATASPGGPGAPRSLPATRLRDLFDGWPETALDGRWGRLRGPLGQALPGCLWAVPVGAPEIGGWLLRFVPGLPGLVDEAPAEVMEFHGMLSREPHMHRQFAIIRQVAATDSTVLVRGESGTGKELVARALHLASERRARAFLAVNCAALTPSLLESELFGHVRGAFTGATRDHPGVFERAHRGTLFLDEVAELPVDLQAKLLRVLESRSFTPVGGRDALSVDVRIVAATHRSLRDLVRQGRFREDLLYRLRVVPIFLPPLRERRRDIPLLLWHLIERHNRQGRRRIDSVPGRVMRRLLDHAWPGNVRELANVVEYAFAVGTASSLQLQDLPPEFREGEGATAVTGPSPGAMPRAPHGVGDAAGLAAVLREAGGHMGEAARRLGMSRTGFWRLRRRLQAHAGGEPP